MGTSLVGNPNPIDARLPYLGMTAIDHETQSDLGAPSFDKLRMIGNISTTSCVLCFIHNVAETFRSPHKDWKVKALQYKLIVRLSAS